VGAFFLQPNEITDNMIHYLQNEGLNASRFILKTFLFYICLTMANKCNKMALSSSGSLDESLQ
jgi:hypothetical protein